ncbi:hypothetical protein CMO95_02830 [Candidatus Woesearchaeota archaeon]|nr:hypothetical protein [Candidatus Woesearchaeota archaeon]
MIKKVVYSYWSKPTTNTATNFAGFNSKEAFSNCAKLSVLKSKTWAKKVELVTDKKGKKLLIDELNLPFDNVIVELDKLNNIKNKHWAIGKLYACSIQEEPFMHLDFDAIWFKKPPRKILKAPACFQNWEKNTDTHKYYKKLIDTCITTPNLKIHKYSDFKQINALNCGFIGFNDLTKLKLWYELALDYIEKTDKKTKKDMIPCIMFEQYYIGSILKHFNIPVETLGEEWVEEDLAYKLGYTHLISESKLDKEVEKQVYNKVKNL